VHGRTSNVLTFDVSHKSGWLKALAPWKVACGAEAEGDILQVGGCERRVVGSGTAMRGQHKGGLRRR
jgi:hypothetical protein